LTAAATAMMFSTELDYRIISGESVGE